MKLFLVTFCCLCLVFKISSGRLIQAENPERSSPEENDRVQNDRAIRSEKDVTVFQGFLESLLQKLGENSDQKFTQPLQNLLKAILSIVSNNQFPFTLFKGPTKSSFDASQTDSRELNRRSSNTGDLSSNDRNSFGRQFDNSDQRPFKSSGLDLPFRGKGFSGPFDVQRLRNLLDMLTKYAHVEIIGLPGQPIRRIIDFVKERILGNRGGQQYEHRFAREIFQLKKSIIQQR